MDLGIAGVYMLLAYLTLWLRFRKEANEELVAFVLRHHRLNLHTEWIVDHIDDHCFAAHTSRSFPSLSWGEQIFAVFGKGTVWVNSVNDLNKKSVACSFGYTKKNICLLRVATEKQGELK